MKKSCEITVDGIEFCDDLKDTCNFTYGDLADLGCANKDLRLFTKVCPLDGQIHRLC